MAPTDPPKKVPHRDGERRESVRPMLRAPMLLWPLVRDAAAQQSREMEGGSALPAGRALLSIEREGRRAECAAAWRPVVDRRGTERERSGTVEKRDHQGAF